MLLRFATSAIALAFTAMSANAADLPARSHIGEIFAEGPVGPPPPPAKFHVDYFRVIFPPEANSPQVAGNYGRPGDFYYQNYYGTSWFVWWDRLPYTCRFSGNC
jgi:hypothetical protein